MKSKVLFKPILQVIFSFLILAAVTAQDAKIKNPEQFLFSEFSVGVANMKDGENVILNLNYNVVTEKMVFMQNEQIFDIVNYGAIDTVYIRGGKFIPVGKVFYEVVVDDRTSFLIQHKGAVKNPSRPAAYGGTSEVSSSTYINNLRVGGDVYRKDHKAEVVIYDTPIYRISRGDEIHIVTGKKALLKFFHDKRSEVREYMNRSDFDPENPLKIKELVEYYNSISR